jgi:hypothetical protein
MLHQNPGGFGFGSHLIIGLEDQNGVITWYGFYPNPPSNSGASSSGSSSSFPWNRPPGRGPGSVVKNDKPKGRVRPTVIDITPDERKAIEDNINASDAAYRRGKGNPYELENYNCADWGAEMISPVADGKFSKRRGKITKPKDVLDWTHGWPR